MQFELKIDYGTHRNYPMCNKSKTLAHIAGRKSFYACNLVDIRDNLCIDVEVFIRTMGEYLKVEFNNNDQKGD